MNNSAKLRRTALICLGIAMVWLAWSDAPAGAATRTVTTIDDHDDGACTAGDCTLREAVKYAISGDTVEFQSDGTFYLAEALGEIVIDKDLIIDGRNANYTQAKTVISANDKSRIFNITSGTVIIKDLYIKEGYTDQYPGGGGILNNGTLALDTVRIGQCLASTEAGGGVRSNGNIFITNCFIQANQTTANYAGGGVSVNQETGDTVYATVTDSLFSYNEAGGSGGGLASNSAGLYIARSNFSHNDSIGIAAGMGGGGVRVNMGAAYMVDSTFESNTAAGDGGGISASSGSPLEITGSTFAGNQAGEHGGGLYASYGDLKFCNNTFTHNEADMSGGGIWMLNNPGGYAEVSFNTIIDNRADADCDDVGGTCGDGDGGGIFLDLFSAHLRGVILAQNYEDPIAVWTISDCAARLGTFTSQGYNLIGSNNGCEGAFPSGYPNTSQDYVGTAGVPLSPFLHDLDDYGGPTETRPPGMISPALNHGPPDRCDAGGNPVCNDQRGLGRVYGGQADIGAHERSFGGGSQLGMLLE